MRSLLRPNLFSIIFSDRPHMTSAKMSILEPSPSFTCLHVDPIHTQELLKTPPSPYFTCFWGILLRVNVLSECSTWLSIETIFAFPPTLRRPNSILPAADGAHHVAEEAAGADEGRAHRRVLGLQ